MCEKANSQNITQRVIDAAGGSLSICGKTLTDTHLNHQHSAEEALCVKIEGMTILQLASQLTAAALNCVISGGPADCSASSTATLFSACNAACVAGNTTGMINGQPVDCIDAIDCANNGGTFDMTTLFCQTGICSDNGSPCNDDNLGRCANPSTAMCLRTPSCHTQPLCSSPELCFEPPGSAGSSKQCKDARQNTCTIFSGAPPCAQ